MSLLECHYVRVSLALFIEFPDSDCLISDAGLTNWCILINKNDAIETQLNY